MSIVPLESALINGVSIEEYNEIYRFLCLALITMDESQLIELFHDLEDLETVQRIADTAYNFLESREGSDICGEHGKSEYEEWKEQDDKQRYNDIKGQS
jgi:hypothetical protein